MERLVIVGNGMATAKLLQELAAGEPCGYHITVIGDEPQPAYNRILLSRLLGREITPESLALFAPDWLSRQGIEQICGHAVTTLDVKRRCVVLTDGRTLAFDRLVLATGAQAIVPSIPGMAGDQVYTFRTWQDCAALQQLGDDKRRIIVAGGGLLGIEAACGLATLGASVTVVHSGPWPLNRQLDQAAGELLASALRERGITLLLGQRCGEVTRQTNGRLTGVVLEQGRPLPADALVCAIGIRPNDTLAAAAGLCVQHGICVDGLLRTSQPGIHALGECARVNGENVGLMEPVNQQAAILAKVLRGQSPAPWQPAATPTRLKVTGEEVFSTGALMDDEADALTFCDPQAGVYRKLLVRDQTLVGAVLYGDTSDGNWYHQMIMSRSPVHGIRQQLLFGQAASEAVT